MSLGFRQQTDLKRSKVTAKVSIVFASTTSTVFASFGMVRPKR